MHWLRSPGWYIAAALVLCCALYWPGLGGAIVFDGVVAITENAALNLDPSRFINWLLAVFSSASGPTGRPVTMLSFALQNAISGELLPFNLKLFNLLLHCLTGLLGYRVCVLLLESSVVLTLERNTARWVAGTAALLWLLHPLHVSTVLYTVQRMEQLSALFILLGIFCYLRQRVQWLQHSASAAAISRTVFWVCLCLVLAVLAKEDGVLLLPLLLFTEVIFYRFTYLGAVRARLVQFSWGCFYLALALFVVIALFPPAWLTESYLARPYDLSERLLTESRVLWRYLGWFVLPDIRSMSLHHDDLLLSTGWLNPLTTLPAAAAWLLALILLPLCARRWPIVAFAVGWYLISHVLESSLLPLDLVYEHRNYLPLWGPCLLVGWLIWGAASALSTAQRKLICALLLLLLALQLVSRTSLWGDEEQLAAYHLHHHPESLRSVYHYANTQLRLAEQDPQQAEFARRLELSRQHYVDMLRLDAADFPALVSLLYLDSRYFSSHESQRWSAALLQHAASRTLLRTDISALGFLLKCMLTQYCDLAPEQYRLLLSTLAQRYPAEPLYGDFDALYLGEGLADYPAAIARHERLLREQPDYLPAYIGLIAWYERSGEHGQALETIRRLLAQDASLTQVQTIKNSFVAGAP